MWGICFSFRETFLVTFLSLLCGSDYSEKGSFFTYLKRKETQNVSFAIFLVFLRPHYLSVLSLSFKLQSVNVN